VSLIARHLEENGIPTVVIGSAKDIVEYTAVARFVFTDFPLGNPAGLPGQAEMQKAIVAQALGLLQTATAPQTTEAAPFQWNGDPGWRAVYNRVTPENAEYLRQKGEARRRMMLAKKPQTD
jgi:D-proline reductase (dithiol) PrdB